MARKIVHPNYGNNVFINCPLDDIYKPLFDALVFAIHDAGFIARCAIEVLDSGPTRLTKILKIIEECKYGIHDISRVELNADTDLPRFNMPFECGLFWGSFHFGENIHKDKKILVMDNKRNQYHASMSDISGQDIQIHENDAKTLISKVRSWLNNRPDQIKIPGGTAIWEHYQQFKSELQMIVENANITQDELNKPEYFPDYIAFVAEWLRHKNF